MHKPSAIVGSAFFLVFLFDACPAQGGVTWQRTHITSPYARGGHAMAYDAARQRVVLFGGFFGGWWNPLYGLQDTWNWDGVNWTQLSPTQSPTGRGGSAMAYDAARQRVVLFGGSGYQDTWEWDGVDWTEVTPAQSPPGREGHAMAYDAARQRVVLFGGRSVGGWSLLQDTWEWDGVSWTQLSPAQSPSARSRHAMAYDAARQRVVLFGGSSLFQDTWEWDGVNWLQATPAQSPLARTGHAMTYDAARQRVVLFAGVAYRGGLGRLVEDTWEWDGVNWTEVTPAQSPSARDGHAMAYDAARQRVVLFGGDFGHADTWEWDGLNWTQLTPAQGPWARAGHAIAYDAARQRVLLFGGSFHQGGSTVVLTDTWEWDGGSWTQLSPTQSPQWGVAMAYDAVRQRVVLFGGSGGTETWEWDGVNWTQRFPTTSPPARGGYGMTYDVGRQRVLLFGGQGQTQLQDTWEWDGMNWMQATPAQSPSARSGHAMAYDALRRRAVLFGGVGSSFSVLQDTWEWDGVNWTQLSPAHSPTARYNAAMAYDAARQRVVLFGGGTGHGGHQDTLEWDGVDWTEVTPAQSPLGREGHAMAYDAGRQRMLLFGGESYLSGSYLSDTWQCASLSPAAFTSFGTGCSGSTGVPTIAASPFSSPWTGDNYSLELANLPPGAMTFMVTGLSNTFWAGALIPLPAPLMSWGMPGCTVYTDVLDSQALLVSTSGTATWMKTIPNDANLIGLTFYNQGFVLDPGVNAMGATVSNAGAATIGMR